MCGLYSCWMCSCVDCWIHLFCPEEDSEDHSKRLHLSMKLHDLTPKRPIILSFLHDEYFSNYTETPNVAVSLLALLLGILEVSASCLPLETFRRNRTSVVLLSPTPGSFQDGITVPFRIFLLHLSSTVLVSRAFVWNSACPSVIHKGMAGNIICRLMNLECIHVSKIYLYVRYRNYQQ